MRPGLSNCLVLAIGIALLTAGGCRSSTKAGSDVAPGAVAVCNGCGQIKGTDACCRPGAPTCANCGLAKGSPGCCHIEKGSSEILLICASCGQFKGTAECCRAGAATCPSCGLAKGSPGCCKLPTS